MLNLNAKKLESIQAHINKEYIPKYFPGYSLSIYQGNNEIYYTQNGYLDLQKRLPFSRDTIFRIFSMTKPIVSAAIMKLIENNKLNLNDPVTKFIPEWNKLEVYKSGSKGNFLGTTFSRQMTIIDLLTHTSGLTYGLQRQTSVDREYSRTGIDNIVDSKGINGSKTSQEIINLLTKIPLEYPPGDHYHYSISIDILGFIIERLSDQTLDEYLSENIFEPLNMQDTSFFLDESKKHRLAPCYRWNESKYIYENINNSDNPKITDIDFFKKPFAFSGGAGLLSTIKDYQKFGSSLLDARLGKKSLLVNNNTADLMMRNYLKGGLDMAQSSFLPLAGEEYVRGVGFGLGGSVEMDQDSGEVLYFGWGGAASTLFHISPKHDYSLVFMTQVLESEVIRPLNKDIKTLIASALH